MSTTALQRTLPLAGHLRRLRMITLWQPYATLYAMRIKVHETRGWRPNSWDHGEIVGIHAAAKFPPLHLLSEELHELCIDVFGCAYNYSLPMGAVVCTTRFDDFRSTDHWRPATDEDRIAGDWSPGRYAWHGADGSEVKAPIPAKGGQGWWFANDDLLSALLPYAADGEGYGSPRPTLNADEGPGTNPQPDKSREGT